MYNLYRAVLMGPPDNEWGDDMKIIAHRGASTVKEENSLEGLLYAGELGADLVECDVTRLHDGTYVIYHDNTLLRLGGVDKSLAEVGYSEMRECLARNGHGLMRFEELLAGYRSRTPILLHIKMTHLEPDFVELICRTEVPFVFGAVSLDVAEELHRHFPPERILAFMPGKTDYRAFFAAGAGVIRLWEHWLDTVTPDEVRAACPGAMVWIMARDERKRNCGSPRTLDRCMELHADGILLDDVSMALEWRRHYPIAG